MHRTAAAATLHQQAQRGRLGAALVTRLGLAVLVAAAVTLAFATATALAAANTVFPSGSSRLPLGTRVPAQAPLNPAFTAYQGLRAMARMRGLGHRDLGLIPSPIHLS